MSAALEGVRLEGDPGHEGEGAALEGEARLSKAKHEP